MLQKPRFYLCILILFWGSQLSAQQPYGEIFVWDQQEKYVLEDKLWILDDPLASLDFHQIESSLNFRPISELKEADKTVDAYWVRVDITMAMQGERSSRDWFLIFHPYNTRIEGYVVYDDQTDTLLLGAHVPIRERTYLAPGNMSPCVQKITLPDSGTVRLYAKIFEINDKRAPYFDIELSAPELYLRNVNHVRMFSTFIIGGVILMTIMVIILNLYLGHESHYYYLLYLLTLLLVESLTAGADTLYIPNYVGVLWEWIEPWFFPNHPEYRILLETRWYILIMVYFLFIRSYLNLKKLLPLWDNIMRGMIALGGLFFLGGLYIISSNNYDILTHDDFLAAYVGLFFLSVIVFLFALGKTKDPRAKYVIWGFTAIILSSSPTLIDILLYDSPSGYADSYLIVGLFIEKIIFTAALSFRQRTIEKKLSQRKEAQKKLLAEQNKRLEETVEERTKELVQKTEALEEAILKQKIAQSQLIDREKMASLGQLTAGIAHEINNPINFVSSNVDSLWLDVKDIKILLDKIEQAARADGESVLAQKILSLNKNADAGFLFKEIIGLVEGIQYGAERTQEIVKGLRNFSRLDEDGFKYTDIHKGIDATLNILKIQMGSGVKVHKDYGNLPLLKCQPGKLNQVFMNILSNAIHAVKGKGSIHIRTSVVNGMIEVSIQDSGTGMDEETQKRVFEPFYTQKEVGQGTGLGMFIVHGIIEHHKGKISIKSKEGTGTEVVIQLPIDPEKSI